MTTWLTQEAFDRLKAEYDELTGTGRTDIARKIEAARLEGDLRENGGYHAAKEEQGKMEARIRQLRKLLDEAKVGETPQVEEGVVAPGTVVTATIAGRDVRFLLGSREVAGSDDLDVYSAQSPLGSAVDGHRAGESVAYTAPNGREIAVEILAVELYSG